MGVMNKISFPSFRGFVREFSHTLTEPGFSDHEFCPRGVGGLFVALLPSEAGGEGIVQYTYSSIAEVKADTAEWIDLWNQTTLSYKDDQLFLFTAIRMKNIAGTTKMFGGAR